MTLQKSEEKKKHCKKTQKNYISNFSGKCKKSQTNKKNQSRFYYSSEH